jgi:hypothetical protein
MNAAEMDKAFDARRRLAWIGALDRRHSVVAGMHALGLSEAAPGHRPPGDRAQRKRRGEYRADESSNAVFHRDECCRGVRGWQGAAGRQGSGEAGKREGEEANRDREVSVRNLPGLAPAP